MSCERVNTSERMCYSQNQCAGKPGVCRRNIRRRLGRSFDLPLFSGDEHRKDVENGGLARVALPRVLVNIERLLEPFLSLPYSRHNRYRLLGSL